MIVLAVCGFLFLVAVDLFGMVAWATGGTGFLLLVVYGTACDFKDRRKQRAEDKQHEIRLAAAHAEFRRTCDLRDADKRGWAS